MSRFCPKCSTPLEDQQSHCELCASRLVEFENTLQAIVEQIESNQFSAALAELSEVTEMAPAERLAECYAIRGFAQLKTLNFDRAEEDLSESLALDWTQAQAYAWRAAARGEQNNWQNAFDDLDRAYEYAGERQDQYLEIMEAMSLNARDYFRGLAKSGHLTPAMFVERGSMYLRINQFEKAYQDFSQALKREAGNPWASVGMAEVFLKRPALHGAEKIPELCAKGLAGEVPCRQRALKILAKYHAEAGQLMEAKQVLHQLAQNSTDSGADLALCAEAMMQLGDHLTAIDLLNEALTRHRSLMPAILARGDCFAAIRNHSLALENYSEYLDCFPDSVPALVRRAKVHVAARDFSLALAELQRVIELDKTNFEAHVRLGQVYAELDQQDLAFNHCRLAVQLDGQQAEGYAVLASIYFRLNHYTQSIEEFTRSIELARTPAERAHYRFERGITAYQIENFEMAMEDFNHATQDRPQHAGAWIWKAATCSRQEDWGGAIGSLQRAIQVRPSAAQQYQKMGQPVAEKAIEYYRRFEQRQGDKSPASLYYHRGMAYQFLNCHREAVVDFSKAIKMKPSEPEFLIRRGQASTQVGEVAAAIRDFTQVLQLDPQDHRALYYRALARFTEGDLTSAKIDVTHAIGLSANHARYHCLLAEIELKRNHRPGAIDSFGRAILLDPTNPTPYRLRGLTHATAGEYSSAIRDFTHSLELYPQQPELLVHRAEAYLKINQPLTALEDFESALAQNDRLAKAYSGRASILSTQQRHEYALIWLTKAIHRFSQPVDMAEILMARGKIYYQMARYLPAISDFTLVLDRMRQNPDAAEAARYARALAKLQNQEFESAEKDLKRLLSQKPTNSCYREGLNWLADQTRPRPDFLYPPVNNLRPTRPPIQRTGVSLSAGTVQKWTREPPYHVWIVRTEDKKKEYGPVPMAILTDWASEGRLINGMRLLRSDWNKWKRIERIFPEITPLESLPGLIEEFPQLDLKGSRGTLNNEPNG